MNAGIRYADFDGICRLAARAAAAPLVLGAAARCPARFAWLAVGALLWLLYQNDVEEQRAALIGDVLWVRAGSALPPGAQRRATAAARARPRQQPGRCANLRAARALHSAGRPGADPVDVPRRRGRSVSPLRRQEADAQSPRRRRTARSAGRLSAGAISSGTPPVQRRLRSVADTDAQFEVHGAAVLRRRVRRHAWSASIRSRTLLAQFVPWWFAEKYKVSVVDDNGAVLATKSNVTAERAIDTYQVSVRPARARPVAAGLRLPQRDAGCCRRCWSATIALAVDRHRGQPVGAAAPTCSGRVRRRSSRCARSMPSARRWRTRCSPGCARATCRAASPTSTRPSAAWWASASEELRRPGAAHALLAARARRRVPARAVHGGVLAGPAPQRDGCRDRASCARTASASRSLIYEAPLVDADGRQTGWMGSVLDVTERSAASRNWRASSRSGCRPPRAWRPWARWPRLLSPRAEPAAGAPSPATPPARLNLPRAAGDADRRAMLRQALAQASASRPQRAGQVIRRVHEFVRRRRAQAREPLRRRRGWSRTCRALIELQARTRGIRIELRPAEPACRAVLGDRGDARAGAAEPDAQRHRRHGGDAAGRRRVLAHRRRSARRAGVARQRRRPRPGHRRRGRRQAVHALLHHQAAKAWAWA
ncbi:MAG: hypothetical protein MZV49_05825 [Rhodopseudomonas palustris]|nr:hypothetical protein [Rhodopseudomonas palustris]